MLTNITKTSTKTFSETIKTFSVLGLKFIPSIWYRKTRGEERANSFFVFGEFLKLFENDIGLKRMIWCTWIAKNTNNVTFVFITPPHSLSCHSLQRPHGVGLTTLCRRRCHVFLSFFSTISSLTFVSSQNNLLNLLKTHGKEH